jgi:hypothetical protein
MRIVKPIEDCKELANHAEWVTENTIEISDTVLNAIYHHYERCWANYKDFADCFRKLISLAGDGK